MNLPNLLEKSIHLLFLSARYWKSRMEASFFTGIIQTNEEFKRKHKGVFMIHL